MSDREKVLIIKPGYSETLDPETSGVVSLGDILRTTALLHLFPEDRYHVTWLVDEYGLPMLRGNAMIHRILRINPFTPYHLIREHFDVVINLEKDPGICALADAIPAWRRYGFRFDNRNGTVATYEHGHEALYLAENPDYKRFQNKTWLQILFTMLGAEYRGEPYVLGHVPEAPPDIDFGLNYRVGRKFPSKAWPMDNWRTLHDGLGADYTLSWQPADDDVENIEDYIDWVARCRVLVTHDSLGLHIALALARPIVALFGPTIPGEIDDTPDLVKLAPERDWDCIPCMDGVCERETPCVDTIAVERARAAALELRSRVP